MAKKTKDKPYVHKPNVGAKRGGGSIDEQIAKLKAGMSKKDLAEVDSWVADPTQHDKIRLAFKLLPKASTRAIVLSKRETETYQQIKDAAGASAADKWKASRLEDKAKNKK